MRVMFMAPRFPPEIGGVERHAAAVALETARRGHTVLVVTQQTRDELPAREKSPAGFYVARLREARLWRLPLSAAVRRPAVRRRLAEEIRAFKPDVLHIHDVALWTRWWAPLRSRFPKLPAFITFHGWEGRCPPAPRLVRERRRAAREAAGNLAVGAFIEKWYGTKADEIIYGGADFPSPYPVPDEAPAPLRRVLFLGRLAKDTGAETVLEAWLRFSTEEKLKTTEAERPTLTVVGDGPLRESLQRRAEKAGVPVDWRGATTDPAPCLRTHGLVFAGGYLSFIEALGAGAIVCALYDNRLRRDYLDCFPHAGRFTRPLGGADETVATLRELLAAPERFAETRREAAAWARGLTWARVADRYEALWHKAGRA